MKKNSAQRQKNVAISQNIAARDMIEHKYTINLKDMLLFVGKDELNSLSSGNERLFNMRFGFHIGCAEREKLIKFCNDYDFTDNDIKMFKNIGLITVKQGKLVFSTGRGLILLGGFLFILYCVFALTFMLPAISFPNTNLLSQVLAFSPCCIFFGIAVLIFRNMIIPSYWFHSIIKKQCSIFYPV